MQSNTSDNDVLYAALNDEFAPVIAMQQGESPFNRIGRAAARRDNGDEVIYIDPDQPVFYTQQQSFTTVRGHRYHNRVYRVHFPRVPWRYLTAGRNGGLFVFVTLNEQQQPVLVTTVHTCGCYRAIVPTSYLSPTAYPENWDVSQQEVYGETFTGLLEYPSESASQPRLLIRLRSGKHRVMDVALISDDQLDVIPKKTVQLMPASALESLPLPNGQTTSFFHESGWLHGYVKDSFKPWEFLFMSWWALDINIGRDKQLADPAKSGTILFTSLKPWAREESNLWFFADFLDYWGWRL